MSMTENTCINCFNTYTYYQVKNIVNDCPKCGAKGGYFKPPTTKEYYKMVGMSKK